MVQMILSDNLYVLKEKSRNMINLLSKSPETYEKLTLKIDMLLTEQRHQRGDLATIKRQLHTLINRAQLQKQVDDYFDDNKEDIPEESE